ncbi:MAG: hypothetical protein LBI27_03325 [Clostridiales bacterium]|jgi:hypothetical protein|nr:hypothetical protein [Clostridiales bacterium]
MKRFSIIFILFTIVFSFEAAIADDEPIDDYNTSYNLNLIHIDENRMDIFMREGYIHNQAAYPQGEFRIGATGTGRANGCGPFSIYNVLLYLRRDEYEFHRNPPGTEKSAKYHLRELRNIVECPAGIIRELDRTNSFNRGGEYGTNPQGVYDYLRNHNYLRENGYTTSITYLPNRLDFRIHDSEAAILLYIGNLNPEDISSSYVHYVMVHCNDSEIGDDIELHNFFIYNYENNEAPDSVYSIDNFVAERGYTPVALITITENVF